MLPKTAPRIVVNAEPITLAANRAPFLCGQANNYRDVMLQGACDEQVARLVAALGWTADMKRVLAKVAAANKAK